MRQVFPRSANFVARLSLLAIVLAVPMIALGVGLLVRSDYNTGQNVILEQPVPFSHAHHVGGLGLDCRYCHTSVETSEFAGIPDTHTCMTCHSQVWLDAPTLALVRESYRTGEPIPWTRVHDLGDYTHFNHAAHINNGVACETCHGEVNRMPLMWQSETLFMEWCLDCHRNPQPHLRAPDAIFQFNNQTTTSGMAPQNLSEFYGIRPAELLVECSICHY